MQVEPRKYRLRILNGSIWRRYDLTLSNGRPFLQIGTDDGFMNEPVSMPMIRMFFAERVDVIVDFSGLSVGAQVKLLNTNDEARGTPMSEIMLFEVVPPKSMPLVDTKLPDAAAFRAAGIGWQVLTDKATVDAALRYMNQNKIKREFRFDRENGIYSINGLGWDENRYDAEPRLGTTEVWTFINKSNGWYHPIHIHLTDFQVIDRNGKPPYAWERGRKDTVDLGGNETVRVIITFDPVKLLGFTGPYMIHCHNTDHEDHDMMTQFKLVR
jgi:FtsP/CotA-like multicopper oxidase with cupredoxin domain